MAFWNPCQKRFVCDCPRGTPCRHIDDLNHILVTLFLMLLFLCLLLRVRVLAHRLLLALKLILSAPLHTLCISDSALDAAEADAALLILAADILHSPPCSLLAGLLERSSRPYISFLARQMPSRCGRLSPRAKKPSLHFDLESDWNSKASRTKVP